MEADDEIPWKTRQIGQYGERCSQNRVSFRSKERAVNALFASEMSVVGIDYGTTYGVIAVVRRGGIDIVQNQVSSRQTSYVLVNIYFMSDFARFGAVGACGGDVTAHVTSTSEFSWRYFAILTCMLVN